LDELDAINARYKKLNAEFLKNDGKIDSDEEERLNNISVKWQRAMRACMAKSHEKIDKTAADAGARFKVDPAQLKAFKEFLQKVMSTRAQVAAADVMNVLLAPSSADPKVAKETREKIRQSFSKLDDAEKMTIGRELNKLGIYLPNLNENSPGAEDASARIKRVHMAAYDWGSDQADYVRDLIVQAKEQNFKVAIQIKGSADPDSTKREAENKKLVDDLKAQIAADLPAAVGSAAERKKLLDDHVDILPADEDDWVWAEDNKWISVDGKTIRKVPDISMASMSKAQLFATARPLGKGDAGFAREGAHTAGQPHRDAPTADKPEGLVPEWAFQGKVKEWEYGLAGRPPKTFGPTDPGERESPPHISAEALGKAIDEEKAKRGDKEKTDVKPTMTYNEGGNMLVGTFPDGQPYAVIGRDGLLFSVFHLQEQFDKDPKKVEKFAPKKVDERLAEMEKASAFSKAELEDTVKRLEVVYSNPPTPLPSTATAKQEDEYKKAQKQFEKEKKEFDTDKVKFAKKFLAKMDIVKDYFAEDTQVPREKLIFVAQPDFHIDMHMRPVAPGKMMVNDYAENIKLIDEALKETPIEPWEKKQLESMRKHAEEMQKVMAPVIDEIVRQSEAKGLKVEREAGVLEGEVDEVTVGKSSAEGVLLGLSADKKFTRPDLEVALIAAYPGGPTAKQRAKIKDFLDQAFVRHANFMNSIPGTKDGTNQQFYMTNYTSIGPLRKAYEKRLKAKGVEEVRWMGDDGGGQGTMSASERSLQKSGGLDCRENH
jgi:hypothetical protein